ncbi:Transglutaminase-like superfamily protein [Altererythrobacter xiamenensis]|uniref:Transglutaminase-like superfamily protein n=1 Tax=Altererythrobacter xiamenensis TaxID=1316679 RepID=A0A1Y6EDN7_9SPHN|nr:DUF3857 domain-containing protein [Altererythrobacter xiamenensis]SMQ60539.1 Transglutaminase-like superfamily protein [Altererythrobacter xiamenensis]
MKSWKFTLAAVLMSSASQVIAQNDEITFGPAPQWAVQSEAVDTPDNASGILHIRRQDTIVHLNDDGQFFYQEQMVRILRPQALQAGNVAIAWNPAAGAPVVHTIAIHRDGETINVLDKAEFEILRREDQLEVAMLDGLLTAVMRVPDLRVGDDLEVGFTVPSHDPTLRERNSGLLFLSPSPPSGRIQLALTWADGHEPGTRMTADFEEIAERSDKSIRLLFDDPDTISPPADAPPRYSWMRVLEYSDFKSWSDISQIFAPLFEKASTLDTNSPVRGEAKRIAGRNESKLAQAQAALELVQQQVRYIYVGLNGGNLTPASADETWDRRYGDCKGKTVLLMALLHELGIESEAVLVNNAGSDDGLDSRLPSPGMFDHVVVRAKIDGDTYWLDGTLPDVVEARTSPFMPYRWALPLSPEGAELTRLSAPLIGLPREMGLMEIDARAGFDQPARMVQTTVRRGLEGLVEYMQFSLLSAEQLTASLRDAYVGGGHWDEIDDVEYRYDRKTQASILKVTGVGPVDWDHNGGERYDMTLPGGGFSPPSRRQRPDGQSQDVPYYLEPSYGCHATTVRLPEGTEMENWAFNGTFDTMLFGRLYYRMMEKRDDKTIRMVRGSKVLDPEISAERAKKDNGRISAFDNSMARIEYDPDQTFEPWGNLRPVPATYEIDWTGENAPCLPPDVLKIGRRGG